jgi:hypothetical protein
MPIMSPLVETLVAPASPSGCVSAAHGGCLATPVSPSASFYTYQTYRPWAGWALAPGRGRAWQRRALGDRWAPIGAAPGNALVATPMVRYAPPCGRVRRAGGGTLIFLRDDWRAQLTESPPRRCSPSSSSATTIPATICLRAAARLRAAVALLGLAAAARWRQPACATSCCGSPRRWCRP